VDSGQDPGSAANRRHLLRKNPFAQPNGAARVSLEQDSGAQGALVAIDNTTGGIKAMVGGRDFSESKFDRATQALRQVGSSFKPYVYTTVIDKGGSPDDTILDEPVTFETGSGPYSPHNYDEKFEGIITLRRALAQSRNIPALKLASKVGIKSVIEYAERFGITAKLPPYLAGRAGLGGNHADGADLGIQRFSE
jgi:penicillin-binding protein 1A